MTKQERTKQIFKILRKMDYTAEEVMPLLRKGFDPTYQEEGWNMLHFAVQDGGKIEVVKFLVEKGVDVMAIDLKGWNMLQLAIQHGGVIEVVKFLWEKGVDVMAIDSDGWNMLHLAVQHGGKIEVVEFLVEKGVSLKDEIRGYNVVDYYIDSPRAVSGPVIPEIAKYLETALEEKEINGNN